MRLYKISEKDILDTIESADASSREGDKVVALEGNYDNGSTDRNEKS